MSCLDRATIQPDEPEVRAELEWSIGGENVSYPDGPDDKRRASISTATTTGKRMPVEISIGSNVCWDDGIAWTVWSVGRVTQTGRLRSVAVNMNTIGGAQGTGRSLQTAGPEGAEWWFNHRIQPLSIITDEDRPAIEQQDWTATMVPGGLNAHVIDGDELRHGVNMAWDTSRRMEITIRNPTLIDRDEMMNPSGSLYDWQPVAEDQPATFPENNVIGNDDASTAVEWNNPYVAHPDGHTSIGELRSVDRVSIVSPRDGIGAVGDILEADYEFQEFTRVMLGDTWYVVSNDLSWSVNARFVIVRNPGLPGLVWGFLRHLEGIDSGNGRKRVL